MVKKITDLISTESIELNSRVKTKGEAIDRLMELIDRKGIIKDRKAFKKQVLSREEEGTTGIGAGIAIPHGKCDAVAEPGLAALTVKGGVDYDSIDNEPADLLFLIAAPDTKDNIHLDILSRLCVLLMNEALIENLRKAETNDEFLEYVKQAEKE